MNPWEGIASQMFGMGMATQAQDLSGALGSGMNPYCYIPSSPDNALTFANCSITTEVNEDEKPEEPPDEFTQLSNHKFHELLDRFSKLT